MSVETEEGANETTRYGCPACLSVFRTGFSRCPIDGGVLQTLIDDPLVGATIADRYLIEECIGEGGMGRVYAARHQRVSRRFAIKVLYGDFATDPKMRERFAREAEAASRLSHPNVISVTDFGESKEGLLYIAMDLVDGLELQTIIEKEGPFSAERVANIASQLCEGLAHAHGEGLIHRDFKGENVILASRGTQEIPRIVDFGIAVMLEDSKKGLTTGGLIIGTPATMSPEQATGQPLDARSDLFSLGVVVYEMLAGVKPFSGDPLMIARQNLSLDPPPIIERVPGLEVDAGLELVARKLMAKRPENRFQSADEALAAIKIARSGGLPKAARYDPTTEKLALAAGGRRRLALIALVILLPAGIFFSARWLLSSDSSSKSVALVAGGDAATLATSPEPADAGGALVVDATDFADASAPPPTAIDAGKKSTAGKRPVLRTDAASKTTKPLPIAADAREATAVTPKPPQQVADASAPPSSQDLTRLYVSVGESLQKLATNDPARAATLQKQYAAIPFSDALRVPSMRSQVERALRRMQSELKK